MPTVLHAKCIVVGDSTVGKSALTQVFHSDGSHFPKNYLMTTGVELCTKNLNIPDTHDSVELFIFDSAGKELFTDTVQKYWSDPSVIMVVFDLSNELSLKNSVKWLKMVRAQNPDVHCPGVLVGNKTDLDQRRMISFKDGQKFANSLGVEYFECSAKEMQNVDQPFIFLAKSFHNLYQQKIETLKNLA